jgi:hypothetical protein
MIYICI